MKKLFRLTSETNDLNVDIAARNEVAISTGDEFDNLYYDIINKQKDDAKEGDTDTAEDTDSNLEDSATDEPNDAEDPVEGSDDGATDDPAGDDDVAVEEYLDIYKTTLAQEDFFTKDNFKDIAVSGASTVAHGAMDTLKYLGELGIEYGPIAARKIAKGVMFTLSKLVKGLLLGSIALARFAKKRVVNFKRYKDRVRKLKVSLSLIDNKDTDNVSSYTNAGYIAQLKIQNNYAFDKNSENLLELFKNLTDVMEHRVRDSIISTGVITKQAIKGNISKPARFMTDTLVFPGFSKRTIAGYDTPNDFTEAYAFNKPLPGDAFFIGYGPKDKLDTDDNVKTAYDSSKMFLGISQSNLSSVDTVPYLAKANIKKYLDTLDVMCDIGISQVKVYDNIVKLKKSLKGNLKEYLAWLYASKDKVSVKAALSEYVYLKGAFIDTTFIAGSMLLQNYTLRHLNAATHYCKDAIKHYS